MNRRPTLGISSAPRSARDLAPFLLPGAVRTDPAVRTWLEAEPDGLRRLAARWFEAMRDCGDDVREILHDGCPTACVRDAAFGYVAAFSTHVNVGFFHGATLRDPSRLLEGTGKRMRHVKLRLGGSVDEAALASLICAAHADIRARTDEHRPDT